jgi:Flp pilus assembly protein TadG
MTFLHQGKNRQSEDGQILLVFAFLLPVLLMFAGLAVDYGFAYVTKTTLSKAVDAAALAAMRNINQGQSRATAIAQSAFNVNYETALGRDSTHPVVNIAITTDASNNTVVNVNATATINTFFIHLLSGSKTLTVSSSAQTTRPKLIMSLVLDKSGSMNRNGGAQALPPAVDNFLTYFDDNTARVTMVSFSSIATVNVSIRTNFTSIITSAVNRMPFGGATYARGGLLNGQTQINSIPTLPGENVVKVAVFFTDGWANTVNDSLNCPPSSSLNFGGCAPPEAAVGWCSGISFMDPNTGNGRSCGAAQFPSQSAGSMRPLTQINIANDAMYRSVLVANSMRTQGIVIYAIGLGDKISQPFLQQVANDPSSSTFDPNQPVGQAVFAPTPAELQTVFQTIAAKILLRLSQ